ncbi:unnamed protein product [Bursaphelenchus xylophilus]|uniref:Protein aurora borealis n=1 Tax=Bursaphelenchus xylophilus TaxID=6326 RepID=A0A1I7S397_BURXY|nr:unnamed protein product [Bursaphelenchus xylophilus]CAG9116157.1 unnamed protein product [Bursaphelenchus xylophilus]
MSTPSRSNKSRNLIESGGFGRLIFSPGVFKSPKCESDDSSKEFCWTLEEQSFMAPAFVELNQAVEEYHEEKDEGVQVFVDRYFKHEHYIPSPDLGASTKNPVIRHSIFSSKSSNNSRTIRDVGHKAVQTDLHIPLDFDFESLVKERLGDSFMSVDSSFSSIKRRRRANSLLTDIPADSPNLDMSEIPGTSASLSFDPSLSELKFDSTDNNVQSLEVMSSSFNSDGGTGPLGEVSDEYEVVREKLDLSPIQR